MAENPYAPPRTPGANKRTRKPMPIALAGLIGAALDFIGTFAFGLAASLLVAALVAAAGGSEADIRAMLESGGWQGFSVAIGATFTGVGGFIAARLAAGRELAAALVAGALALATGEVMVAMSDGYEAWMRIAGGFVAIPAALFGGWVRKIQSGSG